MWGKVGGADPATSQSYTWNDLVGGGFISTNAYPTYVNFTLPFAASAAKTRFVSMTSTAQWGVGGAGSGVTVSIYVNGNVCGANSASGSGVPSGLRISSTCTFKIPPGVTPSVVVQHIAGGAGAAYLNIDAPIAPMVAYVTNSY